MKRREFIKASSLTAASMMVLPSILKANAARKNIGLQLYTLRDTIVKDPKSDLQKVASFGYTELECFGYADGKIFGMDYAEFNKYVNGLGMKVTSGHYGLNLVKDADAWKKAVADAKMNGQKYMVMPYIVESDRKAIDDYKKICESLNKAGEVCKNNGIRFGYHNHAFEFQTVDGEIPYDVMLKSLDTKYVGMEMDIFWIINAGQDPIKYFEKYPGRFEQWHVKDMDKADRNHNADVGKGSIDFKTIFTKAKLSGMKHFYVEQESYAGAPIDSAAACAKYLKTIL